MSAAAGREKEVLLVTELELGGRVVTGGRVGLTERAVAALALVEGDEEEEEEEEPVERTMRPPCFFEICCLLRGEASESRVG